MLGDYELIEEIARGGMGIIYRARQVSLDRIVAVKLLLFGPYSSREFVQRFRAEAAAAASLQHPNVVIIHEVGFRDGQHFFAMDYVAGPSLGDMVRKGPLDPRRAARYAQTIAETVHYAHENGILHRDLKPSNVLIDSFDEPKITDFGLAKRLEEETDLTLSGQVLGSPNYMPPEQAAARRGAIGKHSDVYSLGAILYHLITGRPPFHTQSVAETLRQVLHSDPAPPRSLNLSVPRDLETICLKCLEKDPLRRYATAQNLADDLGRFLRDETILARPAGRAEKAWRWTRRNFAVAAAALVVCIASALLIWQGAHGSKMESASRFQRDLDQARIYAGDMKLAHAAYKTGNSSRALELLRNHQPQPGTVPAFEWRWLYQLCVAQGEVIDKHMTSFGSLDVSVTSPTVAFGTRDGFVRLFDIRNRQFVTSWKAHDEFIRTMAFHPRNANWLATISGRDGLLKVWDIATQRTLLTTNAAKGIWPNVTFSAQGDFLSAGAPNGRSFNLWEFRHSASGEVPSLILRTNLPFSGPAAFAPDGRNLALCNGSLMRRAAPLDAPSLFLPDEKRDDSDEPRPASYSFDEELALFDLSNGAFTPFPKAHRDFIMCVAFSPDGQWIATGGADDYVMLRNRRDPARNRRLEAKGITNVTALAFTPDGNALYAGGLDRAIRFWKLDPGTETNTFFLHGHSDSIHSLAFSRDGQWLISTGEGVARLWRLPTEQNVSKTPQTAEFAKLLEPDQTRDGPRIRYWTLIEVGPDQRTAAVVALNKLALVDLSTGIALVTTNVFESAPTAIRSIAFSQDRKTIVAGGVNGSVAFLDAKTLRRLAPPLAIHDSRITGIAFCLNGSAVATGGGKEVKITEVESGHLLRTIRAVEVVDPEIRGEEGIDTLQTLAVSPDGKLLAMGSPEQFVRLWAIDSGQLITSTPEPIKLLYALEFSPDGKTLAIADGKSICVWSFNPHRPLRRWPAHTSRLTALAFSPDGRRLASASCDQTIKIWNPEIDQELAVLDGHDALARGVAFGLGGDVLIAGSHDGSLKVWRALPLERIPDRMPRPAGRGSR